CQQNYVLPLTF
nr:immunoglobulin light chain junction region [Macaca mulatta]MOY01676.1 immunoglobulin light chain junction region [Macaca mulatta]MOY04064.1 immunoglobulin light chain junction region [Macaca mulatta]